MANNTLAVKIRDLVDHLREKRASAIGLADIASVTEVLITTMNGYFRSIDVSIYREFKELSDYLENARHEIAKLTPKDLEEVRIPRAGQELAAIMQSTEKATNDIMESAETIMGELGDNKAVEEACMCIFEACSFQDITGQRISKVVSTLEHVEGRILRLKTLFEVEGLDDSDPHINQIDGDVALHGPALDGEGMDQSAIDALLKDDPGTAAAPLHTEAESEAESEAETAGVKDASQAEIDAMFT